MTLNGVDVYLGNHGSAESKAEYDRRIAEWLIAGRTTVKASAKPAPAATVGEVLLAYWDHAGRYYRAKDGQPTQEVNNIRDALNPDVSPAYWRTIHKPSPH